MRRKKSCASGDKIAARLADIKLETAKAKLAILEDELFDPKDMVYERYEDAPPLCPEEREELKREFIERFERMDETARQEKRRWYLSLVDFAP